MGLVEACFLKHYYPDVIFLGEGKNIWIEINDQDLTEADFNGEKLHFMRKRLPTKIGKDTKIWPNVFLINCDIGERSEIKPNCYLENFKCGENSEVRPGMRILDGKFGNNAQLGRYDIHEVDAEDNCRLGHVEVRDSNLGPNFTASHHGCVLMTDAGKYVGFSAGAIVCNFSGSKKGRLIIEDYAFIGSDVMIIVDAPTITIPEGIFIAASSVVTGKFLKTVPPYSVIVGRNEILPRKKCEFTINEEGKGRWEIVKTEK